MRKYFAARFDVVASIAVLAVVMLLAMWGEHPTVTCTMPREAVRQLVLTRDTDREHLSRDRMEAVRIERRFTASRAGSSDRRDDVDTCEARLAHEIVATHGVTAEQARR